MLFPDQKVNIKIDNMHNYRFYCLTKGYCGEIGDTIEVRVDDLPVTSKLEVKIICDDGASPHCYNIFSRKWRSHLLLTQNDGSPDSCRSCASMRSSEGRRTDFATVKELFASKNLILISDERDYINNKTPLQYICPKHSESIQLQSYNGLMKKAYSCQYCWSEKRVGEGCPNWKGGVTSEYHSVRTSKEYGEWRKLVFERDKYTCQCCGSFESCQLEAHHIYSFYLYEKLRFETDNGITMCKSCHSMKVSGSFHSTYGTKNNVGSQLIGYFMNKKGHINPNLLERIFNLAETNGIETIELKFLSVGIDLVPYREMDDVSPADIYDSLINIK